VLTPCILFYFPENEDVLCRAANLGKRVDYGAPRATVELNHKKFYNFIKQRRLVFTRAATADVVVLLEPRLQWKITSFRECRHSQNRRHLRRGATAPTTRIFLADTSNAGAIPPSAASSCTEAAGPPRCRWSRRAAVPPSCRATEMQMEPASRCSSKLPGHRDAARDAPLPSCSVSHHEDGVVLSLQYEYSGERGTNPMNWSMEPRPTVNHVVISALYAPRVCIGVQNVWFFVTMAQL